MRLIITFLSLLLLSSCHKDDTTQYPKSYLFHHIDQTQEGLFVVTGSNSTTQISSETGSFGAFKDELKTETADAMRQLFHLQEIELLNETMARVIFTFDKITVDTVLTYTRSGEMIIIEVFAGTDLLIYNADDDQFEMCGRTTFAIPGPNVVSPGQAYFQFDVTDCIPDFTPQDYADKLLVDFPYEMDDTIGVFITKLIYK